MRLNNIKKKPLRVLSFIILTWLICTLTVGNLMLGSTMTVLCMWIFAMPRLTFEDSLYKEKMPKFLMNKDFINKFIKVFIPLVLGTLYFLDLSKTNSWFDASWKFTVCFIAPIIFSAIIYALFSKSENQYDVLMPILVSFLTVFAVEFIVGNIGKVFTSIISVFTEGKLLEGYTWVFMLQVMLVYGLFRVLSVILPARTLAMSFTSLICIIFAYVHSLFIQHIEMPFRATEVINYKDTVALLKILFTEHLDIPKVALIVAIFIAIVIVAFLFSKRSTVYIIPRRIKSFLCGLAILLLVASMFSMFYKPDGVIVSGEPMIGENYNEGYGYLYYIANDYSTNEYTGELREKIDAEVYAIFGGEPPAESVPETTLSEITQTPETTVIPEITGEDTIEGTLEDTQNAGLGDATDMTTSDTSSKTE